MDIADFLKQTYSVQFGHQSIRPRVFCNDGFNISIQAGYCMYSTPRENLKSGLYSSVELGYPSELDELINGLGEDRNTTQTVFGYVDIDLVDELIKKHGGINEDKTFKK